MIEKDWTVFDVNFERKSDREKSQRCNCYEEAESLVLAYYPQAVFQDDFHPESDGSWASMRVWASGAEKGQPDSHIAEIIAALEEVDEEFDWARQPGDDTEIIFDS